MEHLGVLVLEGRQGGDGHAHNGDGHEGGGDHRDPLGRHAGEAG